MFKKKIKYILKTIHFLSQFHLYQVSRPVRMPAFMLYQPALSLLAMKENLWSFSSLSSTSRRLTVEVVMSRSSPQTSTRVTCMGILSIILCLVSYVMWFCRTSGALLQKTGDAQLIFLTRIFHYRKKPEGSFIWNILRYNRIKNGYLPSKQKEQKYKRWNINDINRSRA